MNVSDEVHWGIERLTEKLLHLQANDGSWRFCFDNGIGTDAYMIIVLRTLEWADETVIRQLHDRILAAQRTDGSWRLYFDEEEGSLSATADAYYALLYSGYSRKTDEPLRKAKKFILDKGGLRNVKGVLTKVVLAATGQYPWPNSSIVPLEFLLLPPSSPLSFFDFAGFARIHLAPVLLMADRRFSIKTEASPDLSDLTELRSGSQEQPRSQAQPSGLQSLFDAIQTGVEKLSGIPRQFHELAVKKAERYMLDRIESDGTLYSYASSTILMIFALLALGYDKRHPVIIRAVLGLKSMLCSTDGQQILQNSPSTVWDTALISYALQEAGAAADSAAIRNAASYLLARQQRKIGDWSVRNRNPVPGGWGFSDSNTINPDVDDTTAALRAIKKLSAIDPAFRDAADRGLNWVVSMQNDDGGWPAFERNTDNELLAWLPVIEAKAAAIDPSAADLTGRTLEYLGNTARLGIRHSFIRLAADWLIDHQEQDGSWYGRWGICYIYGTWAALTGMMAVGADPDHRTIRKGAEWLLSIQNPDGGWGESCRSDRLLRYVPLGASTPSQTAWALDALIAFHPKPVPAVDKGIRKLIAALQERDWTTAYPTGAGLPGFFYMHYHSYRYIWPLLTLSHYRRKYAR